jgi:hypothetical protein
VLKLRKATVAGVLAATLAGVATSVAHAAPASDWQPTVGEGFALYNEAVGGSMEANDSIGPITSTPNGSSYQTWVQIPTSSQGYLLQNVGTSQCLQAPLYIGQHLFMATCNPYVPTQRWKFVVEGDKTLISRASNTGEVIGATQLGGSLEYQTKSSSPRQLWDVTPAG